MSEVSLSVSLQELTTLFYLFNFFEIGSFPVPGLQAHAITSDF